MSEMRGLLSGGLSRVRQNKRYIFWFYVLNAVLAWLGAGTFNQQVHQILDHSLHAKGLVKGFDIGVLYEMITRPEFGPIISSAAPAMHFAFFFLLLTALFLPGVLQGFASTYRLPGEDFFRICGRNLWRFLRLMIVAEMVLGVVVAGLFSLRAWLLKAAEESTNELLPFYISIASLLVIFLVMTVLRIWFDLAQTDVVLSDQRKVRKSIGVSFRHAWRDLGSLVGSYIATTIGAAILLLAGLFAWMTFVPPASVFGAVVVSQLTLLLLLIPRFWQRGAAVTYYLQKMVEPIAEQSFTPATIVSAAKEPVIATGSAPEIEVS